MIISLFKIISSVAGVRDVNETYKKSFFDLPPNPPVKHFQQKSLADILHQPTKFTHYTANMHIFHIKEDDYETKLSVS